MKYAVLQPGHPVRFVELDGPVTFDAFAAEVGYPMQVLNLAATDVLGSASMVARRMDSPFYPDERRVDNVRGSAILGSPVKGTVVLTGPTDPLGQSLTGLPPEWLAFLAPKQIVVTP